MGFAYWEEPMIETMTGQELSAYAKAGRLWKAVENRKGSVQTSLIIAEDSRRAAVAYATNTDRNFIISGFRFEILPAIPADIYGSDDSEDWKIPVRVLVDENPETTPVLI